MSGAFAGYAALVLSAVAVVLASIGLVGLGSMSSQLAASQNANGGGGSGGAVPVLLSIYDNRSQVMVGPNTWTNVVFNNHLFLSDSWVHDFESDVILCNRSDLYSVYFSIQAQLNTNNDDGQGMASAGGDGDNHRRRHHRPHHRPDEAERPECKGCHLRYSIRGTQQPVNTGNILEIPGSLTYSGGANFFLAKQFYINATAGDAFRFQFVSLCEDLSLQPLPFVMADEPAPVPDSYPASATLLIS